MKKTYDWNVSLLVDVQNNNKKVSIICSVHTNIHQLKIQILKKLGMLIFDTQIDLYGGNSTWKPMKPTSSLQQNGIEKNTTITAVINRIKENKPLDIRVQEDYDKKIKQQLNSDGFGLSLRASCTNQSCVNFSEDVFINFGYGNFPIYSLISNLKCQKCPYKSQYLRPTMLCKSVKVEKCIYKLSGIVIDHHFISNKRQTKYAKVTGEKNILKIIQNGDNKWEKNLIIHIKRP